MSEALGFLGLTKRAGKLAAGEDAILAALAEGKVRLLLLASDAGEKTVRRAEFKSQGKLPIIYLESDKTALGEALGWGKCAVAAVTDIDMALAFARKMAEADPKHASAAQALAEKQQKIAARKAKKPRKR
ncbi:MAG: ribosomal L7Ae/L30e/S12e/Gadd45 family protein [Oscillospiraceae bacterium]|nr:ribosomal L7Ae/L30e/S12e/Gadd45 family protein [Oscillospiraceae bacterium]